MCACGFKSIQSCYVVRNSCIGVCASLPVLHSSSEKAETMCIDLFAQDLAKQVANLDT